MKSLSILGSTGSIGQATLGIVRRFPGRFAVKALAAAGRNIGRLADQVREFRPEAVAVLEKAGAEALEAALGEGFPTRFLHGEEGLRRAAGWPSARMTVAAMVGSAGLLPALAAIEEGKDLALANKETLVMAGDLVLAAAARKGVKVLPVDSEHSAVFQCMAGHPAAGVDRILLTASGGPFLRKPRSEFSGIRPGDALRHPTWRMGDKITVDSATLMNKGLEVIEAARLFGVPADRIEVLVHPQSIVHSMVAFEDGSVMAQLGIPDMAGAIAYALSYPDRLPLRQPVPDFAGIGALTFERPDLERFPCLGLAYEACRRGGTLPSVMNAANEVAVTEFLGERIGFLRIPEIISAVMARHAPTAAPDLEEILRADRWARAEADSLAKGF